MTNLERWQTFTKDYESPDLFIEWGFYSLISAALQRRVWYVSDKITGLPSTAASLFLNQFIVLIGPPSCGKGRVIGVVKSAIEHPFNKKTVMEGDSVKIVPSIFTTPDSITFEALFPFLKGCSSGLKGKATVDGKERDIIIAHNSCMALIEELGVLLRRNTEDVVSVLNQCYDARGVSRRTQTHGDENISNVCVNFLAGTTPDAVRRMMTEQVVNEGFSSRVIFAYASGPRFYRGMRDISKEQQEGLNLVCQQVSYLSTRVYGEIRFSPEAKEYFDKLYESGELLGKRVNSDSKLDYYYGRKKVHVYKLAAAIHFADLDVTDIKPPQPIPPERMVITIDSVKKALELFQRTEVNMHLAFRSSGRNELFDIGKDIVAHLKINGPQSYAKLLFIFTRDCDKKEFDETLNILDVTGQIQAVDNKYQVKEQAK